MNITNSVQTLTNTMIYAFFSLVALVVLLDMLLSVVRAKIAKRSSYKLTFLQIKLPPDNEIEIKAAEHMFSSLYGFKKPFFSALLWGQYRISFEIVSKSTGIGFYIVVPDELASLVEKQVNGAYPSAEIDIVNPQEIWDRGNYTAVEELKLKGPNYYPIKEYEELKGDALNIITSSLSKVNENEVMAIQYVVQPAGDSWRLAGRRFINNIKSRANNPDKSINVDTSFLEEVEKKISHQGFYTKVRIVSLAENKLAAQSNIQNVVGSFEQFTEINYNRFVKRWKVLHQNFKIVDDFIYRRIRIKDYNIPIFDIPIYTNTSVLNIVELATVFHFPNKEVQTPNISWLGARKASAPQNIPAENTKEEDGIWLGESNFRGIKKQIYIKNEDMLRHMYIIGQTGTGKSESMSYYAYENIKRGEGVAFIDPHGKDLRRLLNRIPPERAKDVIVFNPADNEYPLGLNLLSAKTEIDQHQVVNQFLELLKKLYDPQNQGIVGPQLERAVRNGMLTAMSDPEGTLIDVLRMTIDPEYHKKFLPNVKDPLVVRYWTDEFAKTTDFTKSEKTGYVVSKFDRFVTEVTMRKIIGQPKMSLDFDEILAQKKILLVDLAKGKIGEENANFLGLLIVPKILAAALRRQQSIETGQDFPPFYLYVDEFQNFATDSFKTILSEARKYKLALCVAHQYIEQIPEDIKDAVFGNVGTKIAYRIGAEDGEYLEKFFEPHFKANDMTKLSVGNCYVQLLVDSYPTKPFSMNVPWDVIQSVKENHDLGMQILEMSRKKYGTPIAEVNDFFNKRAGLNEPKEDINDENISTDELPF